MHTTDPFPTGRLRRWDHRRMYLWFFGCLFMTACAPAWSACSPPPGNMIAWWSADGTAADYAGDNTATLVNGTAYDVGYVMSAFSFDGVDDWVRTPLDTQPSTLPSTTWEAWVWPVQNNGRRQILSTDDGGFDRSLLIDDAFFGVFTGTAVWRPVEAEVNTWQHVAVVFTPTELRFYKNGIEYVWGSAPTGQGTGNTLAIGRNPGYSEFFSGLIDEVCVYDRALSGFEIQSVFAAGAEGKCKPAVGVADLSVAKTANLEAAGLEQEVVYTLTLLNLGPDAANAIQVVDQLPAGVALVSATGPEGPGVPSGQSVTLSLGGLDASASAQFEIRVRTLSAGIVTNRAGVTGRESDPAPENNAAEHVLEIRPERIDPENGDWAGKRTLLFDTPEAEAMVRVGDIDNLGFGWPPGFNPFSGNSTPAHTYPWAVDPEDPDGTDRVMVVSGYVGTPPFGQDGYTSSTSRPANDPQPLTLDYDLGTLAVRDATLQLFVDDYQSPVWHSVFQVWINGRRAAFLEDILNGLNQTGPIGKLISTRIPIAFLGDVASGHLEILADDPVTGAGDGFANDFAKLLINVRDYSQTGRIAGTVLDATTQQPILGARVSASGTVEAITDATGAYELSDVPAGLVFVEATKPGYNRQTRSFDLIAGTSVTMDFSLQLIPILWIRLTAPDTVVVAWPAALESFRLYQLDQWADGMWVPVETAVEVDGDEAYVKLAPTAAAAYFRLQQP